MALKRTEGMSPSEREDTVNQIMRGYASQVGLSETEVDNFGFQVTLPSSGEPMATQEQIDQLYQDYPELQTWSPTDNKNNTTDTTPATGSYFDNLED